MLTSMIAASVVSLSGAVSPAEVGEPMVTLVDARDLVAVMPATAVMDSRGGVDRRNPLTQVTDLVLGLGRSLELRAEPLADGVFTVIGEEGAQSEFISLLEQVRKLYRGQYEVEIACYSAAAPPEIGTAAKLDSASIRVRQAVSRRQETRIEAARTILYIAKWQPVVADNSVAYDAQTERMTAGLQVRILVGAGPDLGDSVDVRIRGEVSDVSMKELTVPLLGDGKNGLPVQLPTLTMRTINADGRIGREPRVIGVVPGLKEGEVLVIAASARPMAE